MKNFINTALIISVLACMTSCGTAGKLNDPAFIGQLKHNIVLFDPVSRIEVIGKDNLNARSETASADAQNLLKEMVCTYDTGLEIDAIHVSEELQEAYEIQDDIVALGDWYINTDGCDLSYIEIPRTLDSIIEASGRRYGLVLYSEGFSRTGGNYALEIAKTVGLGLLTGYVSVPYKNSSAIYLMILDSKTDRIAYHRHTGGEYNPLSTKHIEKQFKRLFKDFRTE